MLPPLSMISYLPSAASRAEVMTSVIRPFDASARSGRELKVTPGSGCSAPLAVTALTDMPVNESPERSRHGNVTFLRRRYFAVMPRSSTVVEDARTHASQRAGKMSSHARYFGAQRMPMSAIPVAITMARMCSLVGLKTCGLRSGVPVIVGDGSHLWGVDRKCPNIHVNKNPRDTTTGSNLFHVINERLVIIVSRRRLP